MPRKTDGVQRLMWPSVRRLNNDDDGKLIMIRDLQLPASLAVVETDVVGFDLGVSMSSMSDRHPLMMIR